MNWIKVSLIGQLVLLGTTYHLYRISDVTGGIYASSVVCRGFEPLSGQAKDYNIDVLLNANTAIFHLYHGEYLITGIRVCGFSWFPAS